MDYSENELHYEEPPHHRIYLLLDILAAAINYVYSSLWSENNKYIKFSVKKNIS